MIAAGVAAAAKFTASVSSAGGDAPKILEATEHALDEVALIAGDRVEEVPVLPGTTDCRHSYPIPPNRLARNFMACAPTPIWLADLTYIPKSARPGPGSMRSRTASRRTIW